MRATTPSNSISVTARRVTLADIERCLSQSGEDS
jgi:hypothetical protein